MMGARPTTGPCLRHRVGVAGSCGTTRSTARAPTLCGVTAGQGEKATELTDKLDGGEIAEFRTAVGSTVEAARLVVGDDLKTTL
jgi:hypothetical protein